MIQANQPNFDQLITNIVELISKNNTGIVVLPANPSVDAIAASTALYLGLTKMGKTVSLVSSNTPQSDLIATDKIQQSLSTGGDNLIVSFPYTEGSIDKVDYNIQGDTFNLVIIPREGNPKLEPDKVQFSYTGGKIEFIITIDVPNLNSIGQLYQQNQREFDGKNIVNIDRHLINNNYGVINYVNKTSSSTTELVLKVLEALKVEIDKDMATNLYSGLVAATNGFTSYSVNADTFQAAATLLKYGAIKKPFNRPGAPSRFQPQPFSQPGRQQPQPFPQMNQPPAFEEEEDFDMPAPNGPAPKPMEQQSKQIEQVEKEVGGGEKGPGSDWLKPKIFSGTNEL